MTILKYIILPTLGWSKPNASSQLSFLVSALGSRQTKSVTAGRRVGHPKRCSVRDILVHNFFLVEVSMRQALTMWDPGRASAQIFRRNSVGSSRNLGKVRRYL
jgi:hypothetical protein